jgi:hypothetical protein
VGDVTVVVHHALRAVGASLVGFETSPDLLLLGPGGPSHEPIEDPPLRECVLFEEGPLHNGIKHIIGIDNRWAFVDQRFATLSHEKVGH